MNEQKYIEYLSNWIKNKIKESNAKGVIFGLSGGIDSSLIALISKKTFPKNHLALIMPMEEITEDHNSAMFLIKTKNINYKKINISSIFNSFKKSTDINNKLSLANLKARIRMSLLYMHAQELNYLVLGTSNYSEWYMGYFTKYGDGAADLYPIINLLKSDIYNLAKEMKMPKEILERKPSASLWKNQFDEDELGFTYDSLEKYINKQKIDSNSKNKILSMHNNTFHKRNNIIKPNGWDKKR